MKGIHTENTFEENIAQALISNGGYVQGSSQDFDPDRVHFVVEIPIHKAYIGPSRDQVEFDLNDLLINELQDIDALINTLSARQWDQVRDQVRDQAVQLNKNLMVLLEYCLTPRSRKEVCEKMGLANKDANFKRYAGAPLAFDWLEMTSKPNSTDVKYMTTSRGKKLLIS